jgi:hypothetical protein
VDANPHFGRVDTLNLDNAALQPVWSAAEELDAATCWAASVCRNTGCLGWSPCRQKRLLRSVR